jgi:hypothetical protein
MAVRHLLLAVAALGLPASANATRFVYSGTIDSYVVPTDGTYRIMALGAGGGVGFTGVSASGTRLIGNAGGSGGAARGLFQLSAGTTFSLVVGGAGQPSVPNSGGGGGGGSFVFIGATPYVIGGGGGGGGTGSAAVGQSVAGAGGTGGGGVVVSADGGAPGAGWFGNGQTIFGSSNPDGAGKSAPSFAGGVDSYIGFTIGGFGGGGSNNPGLLGDGHPGYGGGGGGGYTGGNGAGEFGGGFAGTSYIAPFSLDSSFTSGRRGDGLIIISKVPEPESWALLVVGFGVVGGTLRARRRQLA